MIRSGQARVVAPALAESECAIRDHSNAIEHLRRASAARRLHFHALVMTEPTTAEYKTHELMGLIATSGGNDRITAQMPAVTLEELLRSEPPGYATGDSALPVRMFPRAAVIAISCALTVILALAFTAVI